MYVVGILTIPYLKVDDNKMPLSYVSDEHIKMLKAYGLRMYAIPYNTTDILYYFNRIHGLYVPSGMISKKGMKKSKEREILIKTLGEFIKLGIDYNNKGGIFPIWGTCFGMQAIIKSIDKNVKLNKVEAYPDYKLEFMPTKEGVLNSEIIKRMREEELNEWMNNKVEIHNHGKGISPNIFKKSLILSNMFNIVSIGEDKNGKEFVSLIEGKKYPIYGVQWHPELSKKTWSILNIFIKGIMKSKKKVLEDKKEMISYIDDKVCLRESGGLYKKCIIYRL